MVQKKNNCSFKTNDASCIIVVSFRNKLIVAKGNRIPMTEAITPITVV